jgi:hypothetical protein
MTCAVLPEIVSRIIAKMPGGEEWFRFGSKTEPETVSLNRVEFCQEAASRLAFDGCP